MTVYRWLCPRCGWRTPWRPSEDALRVERHEHCDLRHPDHQWTAAELAVTRWDTE